SPLPAEHILYLYDSFRAGLMKANAGILKILSGIVLSVLFTACTSSEQKVIQVPTLAVLPSATPTFTASPTCTIQPSPNFTQTATHTATSTHTPTATYTASMTSSPTPECFREIWWSEVQPVLEQFFDEAQKAAQLPKRDLQDATIGLFELQSRFEAIDYPRC